MNSDSHNEGDHQDDEEMRSSNHSGPKKSNVLPLWGNDRTMNLNPLILTNIQSSHYFKVNLYELKTYHEVIDEIYYKVSHLEPWEKGSRKTAGQTGMCGGVRGVGAGGIVSTAYCLLYKLFTLKLTRKQVNGLITHPDSPYIRALGFMYIRYTQPPADLWDWYDEYLEDPEELDVKAGGGQIMTMGNILKNFLCKLEWFSTLFPRIPVPIQQKLEKKMSERFPPVANATVAVVRKPVTTAARHIPDSEAHFGEAEKASKVRSSGGDRRGYSSEKDRERDSRRDRDYKEFGSNRREYRERSWDYNRDRERDGFNSGGSSSRGGGGGRDDRREDSRGRDKKHISHSRDRERDRDRDRDRDKTDRGRDRERERNTSSGSSRDRYRHRH